MQRMMGKADSAVRKERDTWQKERVALQNCLSLVEKTVSRSMGVSIAAIEGSAGEEVEAHVTGNCGKGGPCSTGRPRRHCRFSSRPMR